MLSSLSLRSRFLVAPLISIALTIILFFLNDRAIRNNSEVLQKLSDTNLAQVSEISHMMVLLTSSHAELSEVLHTAVINEDEEAIYLEGRKILNVLYTFEPMFEEKFSEVKEMHFENSPDLFSNILMALKQYRAASISAIELSTVDTKLAQTELILANQALQNVNQLFLLLSNHFIQTLNKQSHMVERSLVEQRVVPAISIALMFMMLLVALYFSSRLSKSIGDIIHALVRISLGDRNFKLEEHSDEYLLGLSNAVNKFQATMIELSEHKFALDQHAIVSIASPDGTINYVNDKFVQITGYSKEELIGQNHHVLSSGHHCKKFWKTMYRYISNGQVWQGEVCNKNKDGRLFWSKTTIVPLMGDTGHPISYVAMRTDVTRIKTIEKELITARKNAEQSALVKSQFLANMSHEIRTPMNGVLGMLNLMQDSKLDNEQQHQLSLAETSAKALLTVINDILDFSKIDAGKLDLEFIDFELNSMLGDFSETMALSAHNKGIELILDLKGIEHSMVKADPGRIRQVLTNLVSNAIKFTHQGEVRIKVELHDENEQQFKLSASVSDTGVGIAPEKLSNIFQSFSQADSSTTREYGGTGLGLSIAKQLCELMGGDLFAESTQGQGSCFFFNIMVEKSQLSQGIMPKVDMKALSLLVVDSNTSSRDVLSTQLLHWGADVEVAEDVPSALAACAKRKQSHSKPFFNIAFIDRQLNEDNGAEFGKELLSNEDYKSMKLVLMTNINQRGDAHYFSSLGFSAYFPKPATTQDLFNALAVVNEDGKALSEAQPLVTSHYLKSLKQEGKTNIPIESENHTKQTIELSNAKILLVEDNKVNQMVAKGLLKKLGCKSLDIANNGIEALDKLNQTTENAPYSLIFMDCQMPEMDGYEATQAIRAHKAGKINLSIPIIAMTANAMEGDREKCLKAGMDDYLSKPIKPELVKDKLTKWLG